jgi:hypothetical protein
MQMEFYVKPELGLIRYISLAKQEGYIKVTCKDKDVFSFYSFFKINENGEAVLDPRFKKLGEDEYIVTTNGRTGKMQLIWSPIEPVDAVSVKIEDKALADDIFSHLNDYYDYADGKITLNASKKALHSSKVRIEKLKRMLSDSDYKVIKNQEMIAVGLAPEYNPAELHAQRQAWRDEINQLQQQ